MKINFLKTIFLAILLFSFINFALALPQATAANSTPGNYNLGKTITITVDFNEDVNGIDSIITFNTSGNGIFWRNQSGTRIDYNYTVGNTQNANPLSVTSIAGLKTMDGNSFLIGNLGLQVAGVNIDTTPPSCQIITPSTDVDTNSVVFDFNCTGADTNIAKIGSTTITKGENLSAHLTTPNTNYTITVDANDLAGNTTQTTITFRYDTNAPVGGSTPISDNRYTNSAKPTFTFSATDNGATMSDGNIALSCTKSATRKIFSFATTYSDFNILDSAYGCSTTLNQDKNIYVWFIDKAGNISPDYNTIIGYDTTIPSTPTSFGASAGNGQVVLNWSAPSADNFSGNKEYKVYRNTYTSSIATTTSTTYTSSGLTNGTQYCFKVSTVDNAGNESTKTSEVCATPQSVSTTISVKRNNSEIEYAKNDDEITINCSFSESASSAKIYAKYDSQSTQTIKSSSSSVTSISETMNIEGSYSQLRVWCEANGTSSSNKYITIDSTAPTIEWSDTNNDCSLLKKIMVKATDNKSLNKVDFLINNITYTTTKTDNNYYLDFNTQTLENGNYAIKAIAYDGAENIKEITRTININNILSENQICQKAITEAKAKKKIIEDLIKYLQEQGIIINTDILNKKKSADDLFNGAEVEQTINVNSATKKAEDAKKMYDEINTKLSNETKEAKNYETKEGTVKSTLKEIGFSEDIASIGEENSKNNKRKLKIIQVGEEYHAVIELTIKNDTNSNTIKVIEIIPKELIDKASKIFSDQNFIILQEDPIIEFNLTLAPGETKTISYGTGVVTKEKSEELITKEIINNFASNPITLSEEIETKKIIEESNMSGMILIGGAIILVLLFIAILIIGGTILLKKTHGFGGEKTPTETKQVEIELKKEESWPKNPQ